MKKMEMPVTKTETMKTFLKDAPPAFKSESGSWMKLLTKRVMITLDGNIGSGKTVLNNYLTLMATRQGKWTIGFPEVAHEPVLKIWLKNQTETASTFQMYMFSEAANNANMARFLCSETAEDPGIAVLDRSMAGNETFAVVNLALNNFTTAQYELYHAACRNPIYNYPYGGSDLNIYLWAKPQVCIKRSKSRARDGEEDYQLKYFCMLEQCYFLSILQNMTSSNNYTPQIIVDWNSQVNENAITDLHSRIESALTGKTQRAEVTTIFPGDADNVIDVRSFGSVGLLRWETCHACLEWMSKNTGDLVLVVHERVSHSYYHNTYQITID